MTIKEAYEEIIDITGGSCFCMDYLSKEVGLDGRFTLKQLEEIVKVMKAVKES